MELEAFRAWLEDRRLRPQTVRAYVECIRIAHDRGDPVDSVRTAQSRGRRQQYLSALKLYAAFLGGIEGAELLNGLTALPRFRHPEKPPRRPLSNEEWGRLLEEVEEEEEPLCHVLKLLVYTGLRSSDIINIEHAHVRDGLQTGVLYLAQKGGSYRPFPVEGDIRTVLRELSEGWRWKTIASLMTKGKSDRAAYMVLYRALNDAAERAFLAKNRRNPHLLRATAAVQLYKRTRDIHAVQKWLGHRDIRATQRYLRYIDPEDLGESYQELMQSRGRRQP